MHRQADHETVVVEIEVPTDVERRVRERAGDGEALEGYLLDEFLFEYRWVDTDGEVIE
jgi:hypothetical protein